MMRWLWRIVCSHPHMVRERQHGELRLVCPRCSLNVPAIARSRAELRKMRATFQAPKPLKAQGSRKVAAIGTR